MRLYIKYKHYVFLLAGLLGVALLVNACKKNDNSDNVQYFLTNGTWQLASVTMQSFVGDTLKRTDTLNTTCLVSQTFKFNTDNSCTYTNYHCLSQTSTGSWQLSTDQLTLQTSLAAKDTSGKAIVNVTAFPTAQIVNLGQYSLVLQTGYTSTYYTSKTVRKIARYGFVHAENQ